MSKVTIMKDVLERLEERGVEDITLQLHADGDIRVGDLEIEFTADGTQATIFHSEGSRRVGFVEELVPEIMNLLPINKWEAGKEVRKGSAVRTLVYSCHGYYHLLDTRHFDLEYQKAYTVEELKENGWELV